MSVGSPLGQIPEAPAHRGAFEPGPCDDDATASCIHVPRETPSTLANDSLHGASAPLKTIGSLDGIAEWPRTTPGDAATRLTAGSAIITRFWPVRGLGVPQPSPRRSHLRAAAPRRRVSEDDLATSRLLSIAAGRLQPGARVQVRTWRAAGRCEDRRFAPPRSGALVGMVRVRLMMVVDEPLPLESWPKALHRDSRQTPAGVWLPEADLSTHSRIQSPGTVGVSACECPTTPDQHPPRAPHRSGRPEQEEAAEPTRGSLPASPGEYLETRRVASFCGVAQQSQADQSLRRTGLGASQRRFAGGTRAASASIGRGVVPSSPPWGVGTCRASGGLSAATRRL